MILLTLLMKRALNCNNLLSKNGRTQLNRFLGANKNTFLTYNLSRYFFMQNKIKLTG